MKVLYCWTDRATCSECNNGCATFCARMKSCREKVDIGTGDDMWFMYCCCRMMESIESGEAVGVMELWPVVCITRGSIGVAGLFDVLPLDEPITAPEGQETGKEEGNADAPPPAPDALPAAPPAMACKAATTSL